MKPYREQKLTRDQHTLRDKIGRAVAMIFKDRMMQVGAATICQTGGRVLNIGFGMGLINRYIQKHDIDEYWTIEMHPEGLQYMKDTGWYDKSNVRILKSPWQEYLETLPPNLMALITKKPE